MNCPNCGDLADQADDAHVRQFRIRVLQEAITQSMADFWDRRAATFEAARPRTGDYLGKSTPAQRTELDESLRARAEACRARAALLRQRAAA